MSTLTTTTDVPVRTRPVHKLTARGVLRSEWAKTWSLRSTWITLAISLALLIAVGCIAAATYNSGAAAQAGPRASDTASDAVSLSLFGIDFAQLAIGVLGVLIAAGEYSTGMIRSTLSAVPTRLPVLWSKALVFGLIALVVAAVGVFTSFLVGESLLHGTSIALNLGSSGVLRSLLGAVGYLALVGVLGVALGTLVRSTPGGIGLLVFALMLMSILADMLSTQWKDDISPYLPANAGSAMLSLHRAADSLSPGAGAAVFAGWVALALGAAAYRLKRADA